MKKKYKKIQKKPNLLLPIYLLIGSLVIGFTTLIYYTPKKEIPYANITVDEPVKNNFQKRKRHKVPFAWDHNDDSSSEKKRKPSDIPTKEKNQKAPANKKVDEMLNNAYKLVDTGHPQEAQRILEDILAKDPKNEDALMELGMIHLIDYRDSAQAQDHFERVLRVNKENTMIASELLNIYEERDQLDAGLNFFQQLQEENPDSITIMKSLGQLHDFNQNQEKAIQYFSEAANKSSQPRDIAILANKYSQYGQLDKSIAEYKKAIEATKEKIERGEYKNPNIAISELQNYNLGLYKQYNTQGNKEEKDKILSEMKALTSKNYKPNPLMKKSS